MKAVRDGGRKLLLCTALTTASLAGLGPASGSAELGTFTNGALITIPAGAPGVSSGPASAYPAIVTVTGMGGSISSAQPVLHDFGHAFPDDVDVLVVSPAGDAAMVMSDACGDSSTPLEDVMFDFQLVSTHLTDGGPCPTGNVNTSDFDGDGNPAPPDSSDVFPSPAPAGPYSPSLLNFIGKNANGVWKFFIVDDTGGDVGDIESGISVELATNNYYARLPVGSATVGASDPYPLPQTVTGQGEVLTDVNVVLNGVAHTFPDDLDLLLVGPQGQSVVLASDACGGGDLNNTNWHFDQEAANSLPGDGPCPTGDYRPTDIAQGAADSWPAPAPAGPYGSSLSSLYFTNPNGQWRLFAVDDTMGDEGYLSAPYQLQLTSRAKAGVSFESGTTITEGGAGEVTVQRTANPPLGPAAVHVTSAPAGASQGEFDPIDTTLDFAAGEATKTVSLAAGDDAVDEPDETFTLGLSSPAGDATLASPTTAVVTIADNDAPSGGGGGPPGGGGGTPDNDSPDTVIDKGPKKHTHKHTAKIRFSSPEPGVTFQCELDSRHRRDLRPCTSPVTFRHLAEGRHFFVVGAVDAAGNFDDRPARIHWKIL